MEKIPEACRLSMEKMFSAARLGPEEDMRERSHTCARLGLEEKGFGLRTGKSALLGLGLGLRVEDWD